MLEENVQIFRRCQVFHELIEIFDKYDKSYDLSFKTIEKEIINTKIDLILVYKYKTGYIYVAVLWMLISF